jgi:hypothetical protein
MGGKLPTRKEAEAFLDRMKEEAEASRRESLERVYVAEVWQQVGPTVLFASPNPILTELVCGELSWSREGPELFGSGTRQEFLMTDRAFAPAFDQWEALRRKERRWFTVNQDPNDFGPWVGAETNHEQLAKTMKGLMDTGSVIQLGLSELSERFPEALAAWERGDDGAYKRMHRKWAENVPAFVADRKAKARWGMLPLD